MLGRSRQQELWLAGHYYIQSEEAEIDEYWYSTCFLPFIEFSMETKTEGMPLSGLAMET